MENGQKTHGSAQHFLTIMAALLAMVGPFTIDAYLPSFPDIEQAFGISRELLSQSLSVYLAAFAISTLFWGPLADHIGRRLVIKISLIFYILASIGCAMVDDSASFLIMRTLQGLFASGGFIAGRAMIRDAHDATSAHRAMSQVTLLFALAPAIAPVLGGWLHDIAGWRSVFWFLAGYGVFLLFMVTFIKETLPAQHRQSMHPASVMRVYFRTLKDHQFIRMVLSLSFAFAGMFLYIAGAPTIIYDFLGLGSNDFGRQFIPMVIGMMLGAYLSSRLAAVWPARRIIAMGFSLSTIAVGLNVLQVFLLESSLFTIIAPLVLYVFAMALIMPGITIQALDCFPKNRGSAASMQGFFQMITNAGVASFAVPLLHTKVQYFVLGQLFFLLVAVALWLSIKPESKLVSDR